MAAPFPNLWHLRAVAETSSKACYICYKPTARVLITPNDKDFFYVCPGHLTDPGFASPFVDAEAEAAKAKKAALDREIEQVKQEYEEKQKRKKKKQQKKAKKDDDKDKDKKDNEEDDGKAEKDRDAKIKSIENAQGEAKSEDTPRVYTLHRNFYQMRIDRIRNAEMAKRSQQRVKDPLFFPSAPKGDPQ